MRIFCDFSCPTAGQTIITIANTFRPVSDTVQETGYFMMNGIPPGQHVYIHCTIKACIFAAECPEVGDPCIYSDTSLLR